jgi:hypothetical protein
MSDTPQGYAHLLEEIDELKKENAALREWKRDASDLCGKGPDIIVARELLAELTSELEKVK